MGRRALGHGRGELWCHCVSPRVQEVIPAILAPLSAKSVLLSRKKILLFVLALIFPCQCLSHVKHLLLPAQQCCLLPPCHKCHQRAARARAVLRHPCRGATHQGAHPGPCGVQEHRGSAGKGQRCQRQRGPTGAKAGEPSSTPKSASPSPARGISAGKWARRAARGGSGWLTATVLGCFAACELGMVIPTSAGSRAWGVAS